MLSTAGADVTSMTPGTRRHGFQPNGSTTSVISANSSVDPTNTKTVRQRYSSRLAGWFGKLNARIREGLTELDVLQINEDDPTKPPIFRFPRDDRKIAAFQEWVREQQRRGILEIVGNDDNQYIRVAYGRGVEDADVRLKQAGVEVTDQSVEQVFRVPVHEEELQALYTRNFEELQGITAAVNQQLSRTLTSGMSQGHGPYRIARDISNDINSVGKRRARTMARTEVIRAHSTATLNRYEEYGVDRVTVKAEIQTAGDQNVCPICADLAGQTYTIRRVRRGSVNIGNRNWPIQPPIHPNCRCALIPEVTRT